MALIMNINDCTKSKNVMSMQVLVTQSNMISHGVAILSPEETLECGAAVLCIHELVIVYFSNSLGSYL